MKIKLYSFLAFITILAFLLFNFYLFTLYQQTLTEVQNYPNDLSNVVKVEGHDVHIDVSLPVVNRYEIAPNYSIRKSEKRKHYTLVLATTIGDEWSLRDETIFNNTLHSYINLGEEFFPVVFTKNQRYIDIMKERNIFYETTIDLNPYGLPYFKSFFNYIEKNYDSDFYGYVNSDILFSSKLINILHFVKQKQQKNYLKKKMLIVGRRINYNIYENMTIPNLPGLFDKFIEDIYTNSEFFMALAMDYFITTKNTFDNYMAPVVIGRPFIDSYVFNYTFTNKEIDTIDGSNASIILIEFAQFLVAAIHQTNEKGNWSGHGSEKNMTKEELKEYNTYNYGWNARYVHKKKSFYKTTLLANYQLYELLDGSYYLNWSSGYDDQYTEAELDLLKKYIPPKAFCIYFGNGRMKGTILQLCKYVIFMAFDSNLPQHEKKLKMYNRMRILNKLNHTNNSILPSCALYRDYIVPSLKKIPEPPRNYWINIWKKYDVVIIDGPCKQEIAYLSSYNIRFRDTKIIIHGTNIKHNKNVNEMAGFRFIDQDNTTAPHLGMRVYEKKMFKILPEFQYLTE